ncbi:MAG: AbrB/MazE/SpoVT family DNA-binding domain-containing protein [Methanocellales archaeon]|nr:AbrB/MazE/SpoVT family DNA-binding domain-containing protein [Methanocellales archaeon]MDI6859067.1 AbrB/MazE/SpoVT family DNA-binding domain-containing protein [Methanocellales archaeon]MDI6903050.1 AbrB/MazE/SpoVT family DNA-binding domain-containing protein [Methanocellales archaeon]
MDTVTVSSKYQVVIPRDIRERLGLRPGEKMVMIEKDNLIHMIRIRDIKDVVGLVKGITTKGLRDERERFD